MGVRPSIGGDFHRLTARKINGEVVRSKQGHRSLAEDQLNQLLRMVAHKDRAAFGDVYRLSSAKLTGVLFRMLKDRAEVEDALQDVFIRVWQRAAQFDGERGEGMGWLVAIARNVALDRLRSRPEARGFTYAGAGKDAPDSDPIAQLPALGFGAEELMQVEADARRVVNCFGELEPDRATAVRGAYLQGLSYQQLAEQHGVPINTMRTWLRRSLLRLKECLER